MSRSGDKRVLLWLMGGAVAMIALVSALAPQAREEDPRPRTDNASKAGTKAAALSLAKLGYKVQVLNEPAAALARMDAPHTTLLLLQPNSHEKTRKANAAAVEAFLRRGGHVLATGPSAELLLPQGHVTGTSTLQGGLCFTTPEGQGPLARAGEVTLVNNGGWDVGTSQLGPALHVEHRCGEDAVVVRYAVGPGEVVWWSSAMPIANQGLKNDGNLKLTLASLGDPGRTVVFDEYLLGGEPAEHPLTGLPIGWLLWQLALVAAALVFSFSRRKGPVRMPVVVPRTSPVEFAESMGHLYARAGAVGAPVLAAKRRLVRYLIAECGLDQATVAAGPAAVAETLRARFGGDWTLLERHLQEAAGAERGDWTAKSALRLVQALDDDRERLQAMLLPAAERSVAGVRLGSARENDLEMAAAGEGVRKA